MTSQGIEAERSTPQATSLSICPQNRCSVQFADTVSMQAVHRSSLLQDLILETHNNEARLHLPFPPRAVSRWHSFVNRGPPSPDALCEILQVCTTPSVLEHTPAAAQTR